MDPCLRIFLADDEDDARFMLCRALEKAGLGRPAAMFSDGEDFLRFWDDQSPAGPCLLLLDLNMPRLTGFDVLFALQRRSAPSLQTIIVSGSNREEDMARAAELGAQAYLTKFPSPEVLARAVHGMLKAV